LLLLINTIPLPAPPAAAAPTTPSALNLSGNVDRNFRTKSKSKRNFVYRNRNFVPLLKRNPGTKLTEIFLFLFSCTIAARTISECFCRHWIKKISGKQYHFPLISINFPFFHFNLLNQLN